MKVLVVGELCEDIFIYGDCGRLSPEAPVPVFIPTETIKNDGMSGNVVNNIKAMNNDVYVDHFFQNQKITKTRFVDKKSNHMFLRVDEGDKNIEPINIMQHKHNEISEYDIIIVSDYDKGFITNDFLKEIGKKSKLSILDSKKKLTKEIVDSFTFVKLNEIEYQNNIHLKDCKNIITTLGNKGAMYQDKLYKSHSPKETIDVSGAGDTFTSAFILEFFKTKNIEKSITYANKMASIVVSKRGVTTP
jgi:bifunctional ADP-heptose synthase (sugar kinase/adenylyltransferase)